MPYTFYVYSYPFDFYSKYLFSVMWKFITLSAALFYISLSKVLIQLELYTYFIHQNVQFSRFNKIWKFLLAWKVMLYKKSWVKTVWSKLEPGVGGLTMLNKNYSSFYWCLYLLGEDKELLKSDLWDCYHCLEQKLASNNYLPCSYNLYSNNLISDFSGP